MPNLITLDEAKAFCRVEHDADDITFAILIGSASENVLQWAETYDVADPVPDRLKVATMIHVAGNYDKRDAVPEAHLERLLWPFRRTRF